MSKSSTKVVKILLTLAPFGFLLRSGRWHHRRWKQPLEMRVRTRAATFLRHRERKYTILPLFWRSSKFGRTCCCCVISRANENYKSRRLSRPDSRPRPQVFFFLWIARCWLRSPPKFFAPSLSFPPRRFSFRMKNSAAVKT